MQLIITDIDGTLLTHTNQLPEANRVTLHTAVARGIRLVLATVRKLDSTNLVLKELGLPAMKICQAGAAIYDENDHLLRKYAIPMDLAREIAQICDDEGIPLLTTVNERNFLGPNTPMPGFFASPLTQLSSNLEALSEEPTRMIARDHPAALALIDRFADTPLRFVRHYYPDGRFADVTITNAEASKERGFAFLSEQLGIPAAACIALGDSEADIGMITAAGVGVAMGDAHAKVRAAADWVAPNAADAGFAAALQRFLPAESAA